MLALFVFTVLLPDGACGAAASTATATSRRYYRHHRQLQNSSAAATSECPFPLPNGGVHAVSLPADAVELATALAACTGGVYDVNWTGAVVLAEPLVVAAESSVTITGVQGANGEAAALDGGGVIGLVDLGAGSSLRLEGVTLRNARRVAGNGGAIRAEAAGCSVAAFDSIFEGNEAASLSFDEGNGGALALGPGVTAQLEGCTILGNRARVGGGGVWSDGKESSLQLTGCLLEGNTGYWGGGVGMGGRSTAVFEGSVVSRNHAEDEGGGLYGVNATVVVAGGSEFVNNTMGWSGGGISLKVSVCVRACWTGGKRGVCFWLSIYCCCRLQEQQ